MKQTFIRKIFLVTGWTLLLLASVYFYVSNIGPYFSNTLPKRLAAEKYWLVVHFTGAGCTLFLGPIQFWNYFRIRFRRWHRLLGKIYIGGSIVSALMVFYLLSNYPLPGSVPSLAFLAVIWLFTTITVFWFAFKKNFRLHRQFMIRSYVCSLAFLFIRLLPYLNEYTGIFNFIKDEEMKGTVYEWICWVYPLLLTEFLLIWWPSIAKQQAISTKA
ncbi:MAG: hypothetical protein JWQ27_343 [Ferruginibacter sp.]|nr:hypothetical protein [Ferruginibacter sp.]